MLLVTDEQFWLSNRSRNVIEEGSRKNVWREIDSSEYRQLLRRAKKYGKYAFNKFYCCF